MKNLTPIQSIRKHCLECSGNAYKEVKECPIVDCLLYPFRLGKNPNYKNNQNKSLPQFDKQETTKNS